MIIFQVFMATKHPLRPTIHRHLMSISRKHEAANRPPGPGGLWARPVAFVSSGCGRKNSAWWAMNCVKEVPFHVKTKQLLMAERARTKHDYSRPSLVGDAQSQKLSKNVKLIHLISKTIALQSTCHLQVACPHYCGRPAPPLQLICVLGSTLKPPLWAFLVARCFPKNHLIVEGSGPKSPRFLRHLPFG